MTAREAPARALRGEDQLTAGCVAGLGNRLRVLLSGLAWEELGYRKFTMLWPRTDACSAAFTELFEAHPNVQDAETDLVLSLPGYGGYSGAPIPDISKSPDPCLRIRTPNYLVPQRFPTPIEVILRLLPNSGDPFTPLHGEVLQRTAGLFQTLRPLPAIQEEVRDFKSRHFRSKMIGVHVRRGDFGLQRPDVANSLRGILRAVKRYLQKMPEAGILLASDDGALDPRDGQPTAPACVLATFREQFRERVSSREPRTLDRRQPESIQDALVELLLLRETDMFVGTAASSFSGIVTLGRSVPHTMCGPSDPYRWLWRLSLIEPAAMGLGWLQKGRLMPFPVVVADNRLRWGKWMEQRRRNRLRK